MSYAALATDNFDEVVSFYGTSLGFPVVDEWDRNNGRGARFDLGGMRLEILDNARQRKPLSIPAPGDRFHVVIEVDDIVAARGGLAIDAPAPQNTSWGAKLFQVRDPDGVPVTFLQWVNKKDSEPVEIQGYASKDPCHIGR
jgi:catechol 2,3-dioxygenase-like lactoylglutathione lyase family enzyme